MTARDGFPRDMDSLALDANTEERLVAGVLDASDAPPGYQVVARTLRALRRTPDSLELVGRDAVERIASAVADPSSPSGKSHRRTGRFRDGL